MRWCWSSDDADSEPAAVETPGEHSEKHGPAAAADAADDDDDDAKSDPSSLMLAENMEAQEPQKLRAKRDLDADDIRQLFESQRVPVDDEYSLQPGRPIIILRFSSVNKLIKSCLL